MTVSKLALFSWILSKQIRILESEFLHTIKVTYKLFKPAFIFDFYWELRILEAVEISWNF